MNVAFLLGNIYGTGGIAKSTSLIVNRLSKIAGIKVFVINYNDNNAIPINKISSDIVCIKLSLNGTSIRKNLFSIINKIRRIIIKNDIDILVSCGALYFTLGALSTKFTRAKSIAWEHSNYFSNAGHFGKKINRKIGAMLSDYSIVLTACDYQNYLKGIKRKNIDYIYNPVDDVLINREHQYLANTNKIISIGNLNPFKNYKTLVEVANIVLKNNNKLSWDIYGEGPERSTIQMLIDKYSLSDRLRLVGKSNNIYEKLNEYSLYVCTSKSEGLPMALIEAKAKKLPIVSFDIMTGPSEIVTDGKNGYLIPLNDITDMANKILLLMADENKRKEFSSHCYDDIDKFRLDKIIEKWCAILEKVFKQRWRN